MHGFKSLVKSKLITDAWLVHYNFFKEHTTLGNVPPAQKMGIPVPFKDWREVVEGPTPKPQEIEGTTRVERGSFCAYRSSSCEAATQETEGSISKYQQDEEMRQRPIVDSTPRK